MKAHIVLFSDFTLRVSDLPALDAASEAAIADAGFVLPLYIHDDKIPEIDALGGAAKWWLNHSLNSLSVELESRYDSRLILKRGDILDQLDLISDERAIDCIYLTRDYRSYGADLQKRINDAFADKAIKVRRFGGHLMYEPDQIFTKAGNPYTVFSPFWKRCKEAPSIGAPLLPPESLPKPDTWPESLSVDELNLLPKIKWDAGFYESWKPGREGAEAALKRFLKSAVKDYNEYRNRPDLDGTSSLSPHLRFGEISAREVRFRAEQLAADNAPIRGGTEHFVRELGWREFSYHLLFHFPKLATEPLREQFKHFPWYSDQNGGDPQILEAWQKGKTGFPIVDAGMRQLWQTGWMHNRVRMIVASFLVKELLWHWRDGERWFWDTLVDADPASNTASWQWAAGCGADAAPYFRIFNPILQGEKFDTDGAYVRAFVPELKDLPSEFIHKPWEAPALVLHAAGIKLGDTYPNPIVDRSVSRERALNALQESKAELGRLKA